MTGREKGKGQSQARTYRNICKVIDNPSFCAFIQLIRQRINITPETRREKQLAINEWRNQNPPAITLLDPPINIPPDWNYINRVRIYPIDVVSLIQDELRNRALATALCYEQVNNEGRLMLNRVRGLLSTAYQIEVSEQLLFAATCHDFEETERDDFIEYIGCFLGPVKVYTYNGSLPFYEKWVKDNIMLPGHIYLDVTNATWTDVNAYWPKVEEIRNRTCDILDARGRPEGAVSHSLEERDKHIWNIYKRIEKRNENEGRKRVRRRKDSRYTTKYDEISKIYGSFYGLPQEEYLPPDTVKGIIAKMKRKQGQSQS